MYCSLIAGALAYGATASGYNMKKSTGIYQGFCPGSAVSVVCSMRRCKLGMERDREGSVRWQGIRISADKKRVHCTACNMVRRI